MPAEQYSIEVAHGIWYRELIHINKSWARQKRYGLMVIEFCGCNDCGVMTVLHEIHMKAPRCIIHINMRAIRQCAGIASKPPRTASYG